jgi:hypothetical protein
VVVLKGWPERKKQGRKGVEKKEKEKKKEKETVKASPPVCYHSPHLHPTT